MNILNYPRTIIINLIIGGGGIEDANKVNSILFVVNDGKWNYLTCGIFGPIKVLELVIILIKSQL